jgi:uncharacterized protein (TIGR03437 family)
LLYVSASQVNVQLPTDLMPGSMATVEVVSAAGKSDAVELRVETAAPGLLGIGGPGQRPGEAVSIFATGLGAVTPALAAGVPAPRDPRSTTVETPVVSIGDTQAQVLYSGLAPDYVGLYQVNAVIPESAQPGVAQVSLTVAGRRSNTLPLTIANP